MSASALPGSRHGGPVDLYSAFLTTAPFILLAISGGITFGPVPVAARHRVWRIAWWWFLNDIAAALIVVACAALSLLVLGGVVAPNGSARLVVVYGGMFALFLLLLHVAGDVVQLHRQGADGAATASASPGSTLSAHGPVQISGPEPD